MPKFYLAEEHDGNYHLFPYEMVRIEHIVASFERATLLDVSQDDVQKVKFDASGITRLRLLGSDGITVFLTINSDNGTVVNFPVLTAIWEIADEYGWDKVDLVYKS